jgi:hypothetical protein
MSVQMVNKLVKCNVQENYVLQEGITFLLQKFADNEGKLMTQLICFCAVPQHDFPNGIAPRSRPVTHNKKKDLQWNLFAHCKGRRVAEGQRRADSQFAVLSARHSASK